MHFQCPRPKLTQLQARLAASLGACLFLIAVYLIMSAPRLAYAQDLTHTDTPAGTSGGDHNWFRLEHEEAEEAKAIDLFGETLDEDAVRAVLLGSADRQVQLDLDRDDTPTATERPYDKRDATTTTSTMPGNNTPAMTTIAPTQTQLFVFPSADVYGPHGVAGKGLPGSFDTFENVGEDTLDFFDAELLDSPDKVRRDDEGVTVYISINVCTQPDWTGVGDQVDFPPQLWVFVGDSGTEIGPDHSNETQEIYQAYEGYLAFFYNATGDVYISVYANATESGFTGNWTYGLAASIDDFYYNTDGLSPLYLVDTDTDSALLVTDNVTQVNASDPVYAEWMDLDPVPFIMFAQSFDAINKLAGMRQSYCALATNAQIAGNAADAANPEAPVQMDMTTRGLGDKPKEQFYMRGLNGSSSYVAYLAMDGNSSASGAGVIGGGGKVWAGTNLTTKTNGNCRLLFGLDFCDTVAYAVPSNPYTYSNISTLATFYDSYASDLYTNFSLSLQLIPCNATSTSQYSLVKTCTDCAAAYKAWVCAVSIPRCMDFTWPLSSYLQPRNVAQQFIGNASLLPADQLESLYNPMLDAPYGSVAPQVRLADAMAANQSRNSRIDSMVQPGPYAELLPCEDLCYDLVRNCPAALGFVCPFPGRGLERAYGKRTDGAGVSCSFAGAVYQLGGAEVARPSLIVVLAALVLVYIMT